MIPLPDPFVTDFDGTQRNFQTLSLATIIDAISGTIGDNKGDLIGFSAADTPVKVPKAASDGLVLRSLAAGTGGVEWASASSGPTIVHKTADETVNASTAFQNDNLLLLPALANEVWAWEAVLLLNAASATPDFKFQFTVPAGATLYWGPVDGASVAPWREVTVASAPEALLTAASTLATASVAGTTGLAIRGIFIVAGTAGNLQLQWAQNTSNASDSKVLANSYIVAHRLTDG